MSVWFGLHLPAYTHPDTPPERLFDRVVEQAQAAVTAGVDGVSVMDHLFQIEGIGGPDETAAALVEARGGGLRATCSGTGLRPVDHRGVVLDSELRWQEQDRVRLPALHRRTDQPRG